MVERETRGQLVKEVESLRQRLAELQPSVAVHARAYKEAPVGLCYFDSDLRYVQINDWLAAINGTTVEEHLGRRIGQVLPGVAAGVESQLRQVIETGEPIVQGRAFVETPAHPGTKRHYEHNYYPEKAEDGTVVGIRCVVQDVTERGPAGPRGREELHRPHGTVYR